MAVERIQNLNDVYAAELRYLVDRRRKLGDAEIDSDALKAALDQSTGTIAPKVAHGTVGLALSGGGIRSATFSLGVLQALAKLDLLKHVDYLSTVSGGGYIGSCVTSLLSADANAGVRHAEAAVGSFPLGFKGGEQEAPEVRHLRNYSDYLSPERKLFSLGTWRLIAAYLGALGLNLIAPLSAAAFAFFAGTLVIAALWSTSLGDLPTPWLLQIPGLKEVPWLENVPWLIWIAGALAVVLTVCLVILYTVTRDKQGRDRYTTAAAHVAAVAALPFFLAMAPTAYESLVDFVLRSQPVALRRFEEALKVFALCQGPQTDECRDIKGELGTLREALGVAGARVGSGDTTLELIMEGLTDAGIEVNGSDTIDHLEFAAREDDLIRGLKSGGVIIGESASLATWFNLGAAVLVGLVPSAMLGYARRSLVVAAVAAGGFVGAVGVVHFAGWLYVKHPDILDTWWLPSLAVAILAGFVINVNRVSLLNFYRDRLADCYIIRRAPKTPSTTSLGLSQDPIATNDELKLRDVLPEANGPYHLLSGTLNLAGSTDISLRGRKAAHFLFSKLYCGSSHLGYTPTTAYAGGDLDLATAMAVSGAAVSAQSGSQTKPGLAVLMALFNLRLGQWLDNPRGRRQPWLVFWNYFFVKELFSLTDENDWFVFVSDGGHFENTGLYPLLERRCQTIVAVDCGADPKRAFEDLAGIIRKARIDFGVEIRIDLTKLHGGRATARAESGFAEGTILYPKTEHEAKSQGRLVYIKPTLSVAETESEDLLEYARRHPTFPQETTADQFFTEAQFESYRELGYQITKSGVPALGPDWFKVR